MIGDRRRSIGRCPVCRATCVAAGIERGDADAAQRAVQTNWRNAAERLERVIDRAGERGSW